MGLNAQLLAVTSLSAHDREETRGFHRPARTHVLHLLRSVLPHRGAGGVPPRPWRPSAWARPFPPEVAPTSCLDSCYGRPVPRRATSCERRRRTAEAEPLGERGCPGRGNPEPTRTAHMARTIRARPPTRSAVRPHARAGRGRPRVVGLAQPRHPGGSGGSLRAYGFGFGRCGRSGAGGGFGGLGRGAGGATTARAGATR